MLLRFSYYWGLSTAESRRSLMFSHHSSSLSFYVNLSALKRRLDVINKLIKLLHSDLFCASSFFSPIFFMSVVTHSIHLFFLLPFLVPPTTSKYLHLETQSSAFLRSTCPYHLNRPRLTTLSILSIPNPCLSSSHVLLSFRVTPDINLTILFSQ